MVIVDEEKKSQRDEVPEKCGMFMAVGLFFLFFLAYYVIKGGRHGVLQLHKGCMHRSKLILVNAIV